MSAPNSETGPVIPGNCQPGKTGQPPCSGDSGPAGWKRCSVNLVCGVLLLGSDPGASFPNRSTWPAFHLFPWNSHAQPNCLRAKLPSSQTAFEPNPRSGAWHPGLPAAPSGKNTVGRQSVPNPARCPALASPRRVGWPIASVAKTSVAKTMLPRQSCQPSRFGLDTRSPSLSCFQL